MIKIAVLGSFFYRNFLDEIEAEDIFRNVNFCFVNTYRPHKNYQEIALEAEAANAQIAIMGASDYTMLRSFLTLPCVTIAPTTANILKMHPFITDYSTTAFVFRYPVNVDLSLLEQALCVKYNVFYYKTPDELPSLLERLKQSNFRTIASNNSVVGAASQLGFKTFYYYNKQNLVDGIQNALLVLENTKKIESVSDTLSNLLKSLPAGVVAANRSDLKIQYINDYALKLINRSPKAMDQHPLSDFITPEILKLSQNLQSPETDFEYRFGDTAVFGSIFPLELQEKELLVYYFEKVSHVVQHESVIRQNLKKSSISSRYTFDDVIGKSKAITSCVRHAKNFAKRQSTILLQAETGTGKEVFSQSIHSASDRKDSPFIAISCGAVPDTLIESELFGYVPGAFTGASAKGKIGLLETANHGTVLLDDIDALSTSFQAKLLRVMQEREIVRVGGNSPIPIDVRFICATNRDLKKMVEQGLFRSDLYYRVNVLQLKLPPLRERLEDIPLLIHYYLNKLDSVLYRAVLPAFDEIFSSSFQYPFPGNVRELISYVERFSALADRDFLDDVCMLKSIAEESLDASPEVSALTPAGSIVFSGNYQEDTAMAEAAILKHYLQTESNISKLAAKLGMSRATLYNKIKEYNLV